MVKTNILEGRLVLKRVNSEINGELVVIRDLAFGTYIHGGGLPQSGGLAEEIWNYSLRKVKANAFTPKTALIIGLGGGSIAKLIKKFWKDTKITGVDIDPVIVDLGKKFMKLDKYDIETFIEDAQVLVKRQVREGKKCDLLCFDTYVKSNFPEKFEDPIFLGEVKKLLASDGLAIFNRLYGSRDRARAVEFEKKLLTVFTKVDRLYPEANVMFVCC